MGLTKTSTRVFVDDETTDDNLSFKFCGEMSVVKLSYCMPRQQFALTSDSSPWKRSIVDTRTTSLSEGSRDKSFSEEHLGSFWSRFRISISWPLYGVMRVIDGRGTPHSTKYDARAHDIFASWAFIRETPTRALPCTPVCVQRNTCGDIPGTSRPLVDAEFTVERIEDTSLPPIRCSAQTSWSSISVTSA